jgi:hypothetical protein
MTVDNDPARVLLQWAIVAVVVGIAVALVALTGWIAWRVIAKGERREGSPPDVGPLF